jgi:hypothetical protein
MLYKHHENPSNGSKAIKVTGTLTGYHRPIFLYRVRKQAMENFHDICSGLTLPTCLQTSIKIVSNTASFLQACSRLRPDWMFTSVKYNWNYSYFLNAVWDTVPNK